MPAVPDTADILVPALTYCCAMLAMWCPSVTFVHSVETSKCIFKIYLQSGSRAVVVFPHQTSCQYSDGDGGPLTEASNAGGVGKNRDSERISDSIACCEQCSTAATDHGELIKRRSLLMAGDDDEVYDKKPQRYAEDNRAAFNCMQWSLNLKPK